MIIIRSEKKTQLWFWRGQVAGFPDGKKPWIAKPELLGELQTLLGVERRGRLEEVCRTMPADGRGPIRLLFADGSRQKSLVDLAAALTPAQSEGGLRDVQISSPAYAAARGDDTPTPRETSSSPNGIPALTELRPPPSFSPWGADR